MNEMKDRITNTLVLLALFAVVVGYLWWDAENKVRWQNKHIAALISGENAFELVFKWNEVSLNPFTWNKPYSDKLVFARPSEVITFEEQGLLCVNVLILLNTDTLNIQKSEAMKRHEYWYDLRSNRVARVSTDLFGISKQKRKYEPLEKGTQDMFILDWAKEILKRQSISGSSAPVAAEP